MTLLVSPPMCGAVIHLSWTLIFISKALFILCGMIEELISIVFAARIIHSGLLLPLWMEMVLQTRILCRDFVPSKVDGFSDFMNTHTNLVDTSALLCEGDLSTLYISQNLGLGLIFILIQIPKSNTSPQTFIYAPFSGWQWPESWIPS